MAARNSKMAAKINIKSENGVLVSEKKLNNAENNISGLFANKKYLIESILPLWDFRRGPTMGKSKAILLKSCFATKLFLYLSEKKN